MKKKREKKLKKRLLENWKALNSVELTRACEELFKEV
jgi:hypothetical protein